VKVHVFINKHVLVYLPIHITSIILICARTNVDYDELNTHTHKPSENSTIFTS